MISRLKEVLIHGVLSQNNVNCEAVPDFLEDFDEVLLVFGRHASENFGAVDDSLQQWRIVGSQTFESVSVENEAVASAVDVNEPLHLRMNQAVGIVSNVPSVWVTGRPY